MPTRLSPGITEVLCYGTAVFVEYASAGARACRTRRLR